MDILIPTFFLIIGIYYLKVYSPAGKECSQVKNNENEEIAKKKCKLGQLGGGLLILLALVGYLLAFL